MSPRAKWVWVVLANDVPISAFSSELSAGDFCDGANDEERKYIRELEAGRVPALHARKSRTYYVWKKVELHGTGK
jgi:hypothetical protein